MQIVYFLFAKDLSTLAQYITLVFLLVYAFISMACGLLYILAIPKYVSFQVNMLIDFTNQLPPNISLFFSSHSIHWLSGNHLSGSLHR